MSKQCVTHHFACDCREAKFKELERENAALRAISIEVMISNTAFRMKELERENAALRAALDHLRTEVANAATSEDCRRLQRFEEICVAMKEGK